MKVGFFNIFRGDTSHIVCADMMIRSIKVAMPGVEIVQFTDEHSPEIFGVSYSIRKPNKPAAVLCVEHYSECKGDWLFIDTDVIVQKDVRDVFDTSFDIAIADRIGTKLPDEETDSDAIEYMRSMPHNLGVVFSRSPEFWKAVGQEMLDMSLDKQYWAGNQYAACTVIASGVFNVRILPGVTYNYPPRIEDTDFSDKAIIHYKGPTRKQLMLSRFK
jgi:hypothetical protein